MQPLRVRQAPDPAAPVNLDQSDSAPLHSSVADVVDEVVPAVVNVRVTALTTDVFGQPITGRGDGSGVVIDAAQGVIVTNYHVVRDALEVRVVLNDGRRLDGAVVGTSPEHDLAVVKVDAVNLTELELGRSSSLRLGDDVIAVGFPLGLGSVTVTKGIVSAKERTIEPEGGVKLRGLLQTDAAINPGNSGGALVNMRGQLVGINTAAAGAAQAENIGFAIPIDQAVPVIEEILSKPSQQRAWLGVQVQTLEPATAAQLGLDPDTTGAVVAELLPGPAEGAGVEVGDVIVRVGEARIDASEDLTAALADLQPGDRVELEVLRGGETHTIEVELAQRPPQFAEG